MQMQLKFKPQIFMAGFAVLLVISYFLKQRNISNILFGFLLAFLIYINIYLLSIWLMWKTGNAGPLMDIPAMIIAIISTLILLPLYYRKFKRDYKIEKASSIGFLILTGLIFIFYEVRPF